MDAFAFIFRVDFFSSSVVQLFPHPWAQVSLTYLSFGSFPNTEVLELPRLISLLHPWCVWSGAASLVCVSRRPHGSFRAFGVIDPLPSGRQEPGFQRESDPMASDGQMKPSGAAEGAGLGGSHGSTETLSSSAVNRLLMEFLIYIGRAMFVLYPVYLTGYLGLSVSWVLLCMMMVTWWKKNRQWKDARIGTAIDFVDNETQVVHKELQSALQMASWVCVVLYWLIMSICTGFTPQTSHPTTFQTLRKAPVSHLSLVWFVSSWYSTGSVRASESIRISGPEHPENNRCCGTCHFLCCLDYNTLYLHDMPDWGWTSHTQGWVMEPAKRAVGLQAHIWLHHTLP